jgi:hypothetical protein
MKMNIQMKLLYVASSFPDKARPYRTVRSGGEGGAAAIFSFGDVRVLKNALRKKAPFYWRIPKTSGRSSWMMGPFSFVTFLLGKKKSKIFKKETSSI